VPAGGIRASTDRNAWNTPDRYVAGADDAGADAP
jgi:hypothetical protein